MNTSRPTTNSHELFAQACGVFPGGVNSPVRAFKSVGLEPFVVERGDGAYLFDVDGNRYIDYVCSWGPLVLGHAHQTVLSAIQEQAARGTTYGACCAQELMLAKQIQVAMPNIEMLRFVNSGTEAGMAVLRVARAFTKRSKILKFAGCYHGHADALLVQAGSGLATLGVPDGAGVPAHVVADTLSAGFNNLEAVEELFKRYPDQIAAVLLEPIVGNAGLIKPLPGFLEGLRKICTQEGALLIFDEVMTGFRVHPGGAQALYKIKPDLTMLGKVIGGGLPVGAFGGRRDIMELLAPLGPVYQAGTLSGNPLAMAAGAATLREWSLGGAFEEAAKVARVIAQSFREIAGRCGIPMVSDSAGTMFGFFFQENLVHNYEDAKRSDLEMFRRFFKAALDRGVYFAPSQFEAGFVSRAHAGEPLQRTLEILEEAFKSLR